ncbi:MAG: hypothetical protein U2P59_08375 [Synergistota bacterium]|nr:hypothetical protein [Synergistota bacterium]
MSDNFLFPLAYPSTTRHAACPLQNKDHGREQEPAQKDNQYVYSKFVDYNILESIEYKGWIKCDPSEKKICNTMLCRDGNVGCMAIEPDSSVHF